MNIGVLYFKGSRIIYDLLNNVQEVGTDYIHFSGGSLNGINTDVLEIIVTNDITHENDFVEVLRDEVLPNGEVIQLSKTEINNIFKKSNGDVIQPGDPLPEGLSDIKDLFMVNKTDLEQRLADLELTLVEILFN